MTYTKEDASDKVKGLVDQFAEELDELKSGVHVKEAQIEDKYIKRLWEALNWNVSGKGQIHRRQEFVVQGTIRSRKGTFVEPDYILRLPDSKGRMRDKLYIEAKLPKYPLIEMETKEVLKYVRQAYRYAHMKTAQSEDVDKWVRLSILTDFEEFLLFDCVDSAPLEKGKEHLLKKAIVEPFPWTFDRYVTDFDFLWDTFERNHVAEGSLDRLKVTPQDRIKKRLPPDDRFLEDIKSWRKELATSMWRLNRDHPHFNDDLLSAATQLIIDRLVFVKMLSDKGIEPDYLSQMLSDLGKLGDSNVALFQECKSRFSFLNTLYNGTIFSERAELDAMPVENKVLIKILKELDPEYAPYTLASLDVRIIGNAYEQYLGEVIHSDGRGVKVERKPEVIKANGVYYTPGYIVEYIVENTLGELLKNCKSPDDVSKLKILDPACGSGSFLLTAYDFILRWYQDYFVKERKVEKKYREFAEIIKLPDDGEVVRLTAKLRRDILLNNIYGVDIDPQAVEVAQFSLCMKALEGVEDRKELETERNLFKQTILPDMSGNIKCGNSLIETDYYSNKDLNLYGIEEQRKSNVFNWKDEFSSIVKEKGFDCIVGNPPYIFARDEGFTNEEKTYYYNKYYLAQYQLNTYIMFVEQAYNLLTPPGIMGYIIPNNWLTIDTTSIFRNFVLKNCKQKLIVNSYDKVFQGANVDTSILVYTKNGDDTLRAYTLRKSIFTLSKEVESSSFINDKTSIINFESLSSIGVSDLCRKIESRGVRLDTMARVKAGIKAYEVGKGKPKQTEKMKKDRVYHSNIKKTSSCRMYLDGVDVARYFQGWSGQFIEYGDNLAAPRKPELFVGERILVRQIPAKPPYSVLAMLTTDPVINDLNSMIVQLTDKNYSLNYILGILNSKLLSFWFNAVFGKLQRKLFPQFKVKELATFPIRPIDFKNSADKGAFEMIISLVDQIQDVFKNIEKATTTSDSKLYKQRGEILNERLDSLVYQLYGLTDDEIKVVEGN